MARVITALKIQKRNHQRVNVYLDGEFAFGLSRIAAAWLEVGQPLDDGKIRELQAADEVEVAYQKALNFLSYRPRSARELRDNLAKHSFPDEVIQEVVARLSRNKLVNDEEFARLWVENRSDFRPRGRRALRLELQRKGIPSDIINQSLDDIDESKLAFRAAVKQSRRYRELDWENFRNKMTAFLARRGFDYEVTAEVVRKVWREINPPAGSES